MTLTPRWRYAADGTMLVMMPGPRSAARGRAAIVFRVPHGFDDADLRGLDRMSNALTVGASLTRYVLPVLLSAGIASIGARFVDSPLDLSLVVLGAVIAASAVCMALRVVLSVVQVLYARWRGVRFTRLARIAVSAVSELRPRDRDLLVSDGAGEDITTEVRSRRRWERSPKATWRPEGAIRPVYGLPGPQPNTGADVP